MQGTVILSGAAGNMGKAMKAIFLQHGYRVIGLVTPGDCRETNAAGNYVERGIDLSNEKDTEQLMNRLKDEFGCPEVVVLTVGGFEAGSIEETSLQAIEGQIRLNFNTAYNVVRPVFIQMKAKKKGRIFLVGSRPGLDMKNSNGLTAYGLAKSLVFRLAELLNEASTGTDIITQVIIPSTIDTPQNRKAMPDADFSKWVKAETIAEVTLDRIQNVSEDRLIVF